MSGRERERAGARGSWRWGRGAEGWASASVQAAGLTVENVTARYGCSCSSSNPNCIQGSCVSDAYTQCDYTGCVGSTGGRPWSGCGSLVGGTCSESHSSGELADAEDAANGLAVGIIIVIVFGVLLASAVLTCLVKFMLKQLCD